MEVQLVSLEHLRPDLAGDGADLAAEPRRRPHRESHNIVVLGADGVRRRRALQAYVYSNVFLTVGQ